MPQLLPMARFSTEPCDSEMKWGPGQECWMRVARAMEIEAIKDEEGKDCQLSRGQHKGAHGERV